MVKRIKKLKWKNNKAWIRIVEAILAIMLLLGGVLVIMSSQIPLNNNHEEVNTKQRQVLELLSKNDTIRGYILNKDLNNVKDAIKPLVPINWKYAITICNLDQICNSDETPNDQEVFANEIIVTSTLSNYSPKKLRFFVWLK